jgi:peroxiredoxin
MTAFQDLIDEFDEQGVQLYGVSIDTLFSQNAFWDELGIEFPLISDANREIIGKYDVSIPYSKYGIDRIANRAVFVVDESQRVTYAWVADDARNEPEYDEVEDAVEAVA